MDETFYVIYDGEKFICSGASKECAEGLLNRNKQYEYYKVAWPNNIAINSGLIAGHVYLDIIYVDIGYG